MKFYSCSSVRNLFPAILFSFFCAQSKIEEIGIRREKKDTAVKGKKQRVSQLVKELFVDRGKTAAEVNAVCALYHLHTPLPVSQFYFRWKFSKNKKIFQFFHHGLVFFFLPGFQGSGQIQNQRASTESSRFVLDATLWANAWQSGFCGKYSIESTQSTNQPLNCSKSMLRSTTINQSIDRSIKHQSINQSNNEGLTRRVANKIPVSFFFFYFFDLFLIVLVCLCVLGSDKKQRIPF